MYDHIITLLPKRVSLCSGNRSYTATNPAKPPPRGDPQKIIKGLAKKNIKGLAKNIKGLAKNIKGLAKISRNLSFYSRSDMTSQPFTDNTTKYKMSPFFFREKKQTGGGGVCPFFF